MAELWRGAELSTCETNSDEIRLRQIADQLARESPYDHCYFDPTDPVLPLTILVFYRTVLAGYFLLDVRPHDLTVEIQYYRLSYAKERKFKGMIWSGVCIWVSEFETTDRLIIVDCEMFVNWCRPYSEHPDEEFQPLITDWPQRLHTPIDGG